ncbi:hypothetical protein ABH931_001129 [Streptacidiphilus sp. MAP12-33]
MQILDPATEQWQEAARDRTSLFDNALVHVAPRDLSPRSATAAPRPLDPRGVGVSLGSAGPVSGPLGNR